MRVLITCLFVILSFGVVADQAFNLFGGAGVVQSGSQAASGSGGASGALFLGAASNRGTSGAGNRSSANLGITDEGLTSGSSSVGETYNTSDTFALGLAGAGGAAAGNQQGTGQAQGVFGTVGIGFPDSFPF